MDDELRWYILAKKRMEGNLANAFQILRNHGIEPVLIKGWAAARKYPDDVPRFYGDIDLAVASGEYERALDVVNGPSMDGLGIDLHRELRHLDTLCWDSLLKKSLMVDAGGEGIRILGEEDHLRVICSHWLTGGGEDRDRLYDVYYAVKNRSQDFDWSRCLDVVSQNRRSWIVASVGLAHKYLGLPVDDLPFATEATRLPAWLTKSIERSWASESRLRGIDESITSPRQLIRQVRNRIPPNPIQSTIFCEGSFDGRSRIGYQLRDALNRLTPSVRRLSRAIVNQIRWILKKRQRD